MRTVGLALAAVLAVPLASAAAVSFDILLAGQQRVETTTFQLEPRTYWYFAGEGSGVPLGDSTARGGAPASWESTCYRLAPGTFSWDAGSDRLLLRLAGRICYGPPTPEGPPGALHAQGQGTLDVTGGAGAYAGALGSGVWSLEGGAYPNAYPHDLFYLIYELEGPATLRLHGRLELP